MQPDTRLKPTPEATFQEVAGEIILIHLNTGVYYSLNDVGASYWNLLDGQRTIADCAGLIAAEYNAPEAIVLADLLELSADLVKEGLAA